MRWAVAASAYLDGRTTHDCILFDCSRAGWSPRGYKAACRGLSVHGREKAGRNTLNGGGSSVRGSACELGLVSAIQPDLSESLACADSLSIRLGLL